MQLSKTSVVALGACMRAGGKEGKEQGYQDGMHHNVHPSYYSPFKLGESFIRYVFGYINMGI